MPFLTHFRSLQRAQASGPFSNEVKAALTECFNYSISTLSGCNVVNLVSKVPSKEYIAFESSVKISRPINTALFALDQNLWYSLLRNMDHNTVHLMDTLQLQKTLYSVAMSFCAVISLESNGDQKTPGTFFEYFVSFLYSWRLTLVPQTRITIQTLDDELSTLPTDYIFNLGRAERKFHVPIKTSTRERAIMLWAHQKLIDGVYGNGRFMGTPVLMGETKLDIQKREVVEICTPGQWQLYQLYIAKLTRIYYLDPPQAYLNLSSRFPPIFVKPFADFFNEWNIITPL